MKKTIIKRLAEKSFTRNRIDETKVEKLARVLKREDLKVYIKNLKMSDAKRTVNIKVPNEEGIEEILKYFTKLYPDKRIVLGIDPELLTGIKVEIYDNVYELSLKSFLESSIKNIKNG